MKSKYFVILVCLFLSLLVDNANAQKDETWFRNEIARIIAKKLHLPDNRYPHNEHDLHRWLKNAITTGGMDSLVNGNAYAEAEVHAAINPLDSSNIVISPIRTNDPTMGLICPVYFSRDFGKTWQVSNFYAAPEDPGVQSLGGGDPVLIFDADGRLYMSWISLWIQPPFNFRFDMYWAYSDDGGETWIRPSTTIASGAGLSAVYDKQWMAVDRSNSPWRGNVYAVLYEVDLATSTAKIAMRTKAANDTMFSQASVFASDDSFTQVQFTSIDVGNNGHVHVTFFGSKDGSNYALYHAVSTDGGASFQPYNKISDVHFPRFSADEPNTSITGIDDQRLYPCPHIAIDKSGGPFEGTIYATWTANGTTSKSTNGLDIYLSKSMDDGQTWSTPVIVNDDSNPDIHQYYSSLTVNEKGTLIISWYDRRDDPSGNILTHYYLTWSNDGGNTFAPAIAVSSDATDFSTVGSQNQGFGIGEYNQVLATRNFALPVWTDGRKNNGDLDIYIAFVPIQNAPPTGFEVVNINKPLIIQGPFPNPVSGEASMLIEAPAAARLKAVILDATGRIVKESEVELTAGRNQFTFPVKGLVPGNYWFQLGDGIISYTREFTVIKP